VVALHEDGRRPARGDGTGQDGGDVLAGALEGVLLLAPGQLQDDRADLAREGRAEDGR
jgi:hypothetical protein